MLTPAKTSPLGFRVDPKLRYILMLAAREREVTVSTFVEQTLRAGLLPGEIDPNADPEKTWEGLWDDDPAVRLLLLATNRPYLLTPDERRLWNVLTKSLGTHFKPSAFVAAYHKAGIEEGGEQ